MRNKLCDHMNQKKLKHQKININVFCRHICLLSNMNNFYGFIKIKFKKTRKLIIYIFYTKSGEKKYVLLRS
jgi:hypothetical protein